MNCSRCGRETDVRSGPDGGLYCEVCIIHAAQQECHSCEKCYRRVCGVYACPFCHLSSGEPDATLLREQMRLQPIRVEERCERCGGKLDDRVFILHGKALCKPCLLYEQDRWEIVPGSPGKGGARVKIILEKSALAEDKSREETLIGRKLFRTIGVNPEDALPDPLRENLMPDDSCVSCDDEKKGKRRRKLVGEFRAQYSRPQSSGPFKAPRSARSRGL